MPKNFSGGKSFKKQGSKVRRGERQNQEIASAFVDDVLDGEIPKEIVMARVTRMLGGGRISLLLPSGETKSAAIRGSLTMSAGAARAPGNILAIAVNSFILLQLTEYGAQVAAILNRTQVDQVKDKIPVSRGFFSMGDATEEDDGFDWDVEQEATEATDAAPDRATKAERDIDIDAI
jgi:hypothetical protein